MIKGKDLRGDLFHPLNIATFWIFYIFFYILFILYVLALLTVHESINMSSLIRRKNTKRNSIILMRCLPFKVSINESIFFKLSNLMNLTRIP